MAFLDLVKIRVQRSIIFLLLLAFSSNALASDFQISNFRSRRSAPIFKAQDLSEGKLAALSPSESVVSGPISPVPSLSNPLPPPPSNKRPALITPGANSPGADLPPKDLLTPPPPGSHSAPLAPITAPASSSSKQANIAVILGVTLGILVFLLVSVSAAAYFRPDWLPCCKGRSSQLTQYERHLPT